MKKPCCLKLENSKLKCLVDKDLLKYLAYHKWYYDHGYAKTNINNSTVYLHRVVLHAPKGVPIDHINGNGLDNRKDNLRLCSQRENLFNTKLSKRNKSGYKGVRYVERIKKWAAQINGKKSKANFLGYFDTPERAYICYLETANKLGLKVIV